MHKTQKILLKRLLSEGKQIYSSLTRGYNYEDNVVFHLKQLINQGLITKDSGIYSLTKLGVKKITDFDLPSLEETGFKSFIVGFLCSCEDEYLIKSHPQAEANFYNLPSGQPRFGEPIEEALVRLFENYTGLSLKPNSFTFKSLHLKTIKSKNGDVIFDDAFCVYEVNITKEQKKNMKLNKQVNWMTLEEIRKLKNRWSEIDDLIIEKETEVYKVYEVKSDYIL